MRRSILTRTSRTQFGACNRRPARVVLCAAILRAALKRDSLSGGDERHTMTRRSPQASCGSSHPSSTMDPPPVTESTRAIDVDVAGDLLINEGELIRRPPDIRARGRNRESPLIERGAAGDRRVPDVLRAPRRRQRSTLCRAMKVCLIERIETPRRELSE